MCTYGKAAHKNAESACRLAALRNAWLFVAQDQTLLTTGLGRTFPLGTRPEADVAIVSIKGPSMRTRFDPLPYSFLLSSGFSRSASTRVQSKR